MDINISQKPAQPGAPNFFESGLIHDLNKVLTIILANADMLMDDLPIFGQEWVRAKRIQTSAMRASDILDQAINPLRKPRQSLACVSILTLIQEVLEVLQSILPAGIEVHVDSRITRDKILADAAQIFEVLMNLLINAVQAMEGGEGRLTVGLDEVALRDRPDNPKCPSSNYLCLEVRDSGPGIPQRVLDLIFEPYFSTKEKDRGLGLGLTLARRIVEEHGGSITAESQPGDGTVFRVLLPYVD